MTDLYTERYKYLLAQKQKLNERSFQIINLYQTLVVTLVGGAILAYTYWRRGELSVEAVRPLIVIAIWLVEFVSLFACMSIAAGVAAWLKYRKEELELEASVGMPLRSPARLRDLLRWYETYFLIAILITAVAVPVLLARMTSV